MSWFDRRHREANPFGWTDSEYAAILDTPELFEGVGEVLAKIMDDMPPLTSPQMLRAQRRAEFWSDFGALIYACLAGVFWLGTFLFAPAEQELLFVIAGLVWPAILVLAMMYWRSRQYMRGDFRRRS